MMGRASAAAIKHRSADHSVAASYSAPFPKVHY